MACKHIHVFNTLNVYNIRAQSTMHIIKIHIWHPKKYTHACKYMYFMWLYNWGHSSKYNTLCTRPSQSKDRYPGSILLHPDHFWQPGPCNFSNQKWSGSDQFWQRKGVRPDQFSRDRSHAKLASNRQVLISKVKQVFFLNKQTSPRIVFEVTN